jgi:hypothetical protein
MKLTEIVAKGKIAHLVRFKNNNLWYITQDGFEFPVPATDISGESELLPTEPAIALMKWIRQHIKFLESAKQEQTVSQ